MVWYVDDSETKCKTDEVQHILDHLNSIEPRIIQFTIKKFNKDEIAVLDLEQKSTEK